MIISNWTVSPQGGVGAEAGGAGIACEVLADRFGMVFVFLFGMARVRSTNCIYEFITVYKEEHFDEIERKIILKDFFLHK